MRLITISGCPASGKSTLANFFKDRKDVEIISSDNFFYEKDKLPFLKKKYRLKQPDCLNIVTHHYELYESMNWDALIEKIKDLLETSSKKFLILEGFLVLSNEWIQKNLDHSFFLDHKNFTDNLKLLERYWKRKWIGFSCSFMEKGITLEETMWKWNISYNSFLENYPLEFIQNSDRVTILDCFKSTEDNASVILSYFDSIQSSIRSEHYLDSL